MRMYFLLHGFNDPTAGKNNVDKCGPYLEVGDDKVDVDEMDYGYYSYVSVRLRKRPAILRIVNAINAVPEDVNVVVICYSNGANYLRKALPYLNRSVEVVFCSAALNSKAKFHENMSKGWNFHIKSDMAIRLAALIPFHVWGSMGAMGYKGDDLRIMNLDYTDIASRHGGMFKDEVIGFFTSKVMRLTTA